MGLPDIERGGPPGGGGMGFPDELVGGRAPSAGGEVRAGGGDEGPPGRGGAAGGAGAPDAIAAGRAGRGGAAGPGGRAAGGAGRGGDAGRGGGGGGGASEGCSEAGRLVINREPPRGDGGATAPSPGPSAVVGVGVERVAVADEPTVAVGRVGGAELVAVGVAAPAAGSGSAARAAGCSSGCTGRRSPSRSALRRARSAWASSTDDEWLLTPIPRDRQRSSASLFVIPSSWASSYTRIFLGNCLLSTPPLPIGDRRTPILAHQQLGSPEPSARSAASRSSVTSASADAGSTGARRARSKARRRTAVSTQVGEPRQSQAPRPGRSRPRCSAPEGSHVTRTSSSAGRTRRHPTQVRAGAMPDRPRSRPPPLGPSRRSHRPRPPGCPRPLPRPPPPRRRPPPPHPPRRPRSPRRPPRPLLR